jgi:hypothetical protein
MNEKEVAEIRRRFRPDKSNIDRIRGCYVNDQGEIVSEFSQPLGLMPQKESEELLAILKKTLSGTIGKNLINIEFSTRQVLEGEEHKLLMTLRDSSLNDDAAVQEFYRRVIQSLQMEGNYLILLANDKYDVPAYAKDREKLDDSPDVFSYFLCSICPVKLTKPALGYYASENELRNIAENWVVSVPELGFMFPAFDDRAANLYSTLYYSRNITENHKEFVDTVFKTELPMPAAVQKETFQSVLSETLSDDCSLDVVQSVHEQLSGIIEEHKANKEEEPPVISRNSAEKILKSCGVSESRTAEFGEKYDSEFGAGTEISPQNLIDTKQLEVCTPDITIRVNPKRSDLIETRVINGVKYILIRADEGVEVNGVNIHIS